MRSTNDRYLRIRDVRATSRVDVKLPLQLATANGAVEGQAVVDLRDREGRVPPEARIRGSLSRASRGAESAPTRVALGRTGVDTKAAVPLRT
jgi:hypothetical protein